MHAPCEVSRRGQSAAGGWERRLGRGTQKVSELCNGPPAPGGRSEWFPATSVLDPVLVPTNGAGEGNVDEFGSPGGGEETEADSQKDEEISQRQDLCHREETCCRE